MTVHPTRWWHARPAAARCGAALAVLTLAAAGALGTGTAVAASGSRAAPIVTTADGAVRGTTAGTVDEFLGIPYAAPPTGHRSRQPRGTVSATPASSRRVARSQRARSRHPAP
jgi:para-nitrobenzyl esterase